MNPKHPTRYLFVLKSLAALALLAALLIIPGGTQAQDAGICDRTPEVRDWLLAMLSASDCATVTTAQLNGITGTNVAYPDGAADDQLQNAIEITGYSSPTLLRSDFKGLTNTGIKAVVISDSPALRAVPADAFDGFSKGSLTEVFLIYNGIKAIAPGAFSDMTALLTLGLRHNDIGELDESVFSGLTMRDLDLRGNHLTALPSDLFDGLTMIDYLDLSSNNLTTLPEDIFAGLDPSTIYLSDNNIATLPAGVFDPVNPDFIELTGNDLTTLDGAIFAGLTDLDELSLRDNQLTSLPAALFEPLDDSLQFLLLDGNSITTLHADIFDGLTGLQFLLLGRNSLTTPPTGVFDDTLDLTTLYLQENSITTLPEGVFAGLDAVYELRLSDNALTTLPTNVFDPLDSLEQLWLDGNAITALHGDFFDGIGGEDAIGTDNLEQLYLNGNSLTTLPTNLFAHLNNNLSTLHLQDNSIASLHADIFDGLGGLTDLRLSNNAISTLDASVFAPLDDDLLTLFLQDIGGSTDLTTLPANIFDGLTGLQALDLSCNALTALDLTATSPFNPFATSLYYLDIRGNMFTTQPTHADLVAKLTNSFLVLHDTGTTPCKSARETGLSALTVSSGTLDPAFAAPGLTTPRKYLLDVADTVSSVTVTATKEDPGATVEPSGATVDADTNTPGIQVDLAYGLNIIQFTVESRDEDGRATTEIFVNRAYPDSPVAVLRDLTLSDVTLEFNGNTSDYTALVPFDLATTTVVATPLDPDATTVIKINDAVDTDGEVSLAQRSDTIKVEVTAEDGSSTETYTITLNDDNTPPTIDSGPTAVSFAENRPATDVVATYMASDVDSGDTLSWSITGVDVGKFDLMKDPDNDSYHLTFKVSPDFEDAQDTGTDNVYDVTVNVSDGSGPVTREVAVTVQNADDPGVVSITGTLEGGSELTASLTDEDGNPRSITWQWARGDSATGPFTNISMATNATYTLVAADVTKYMRATASYTDDHGSGKTASGVSGLVGASNAEPAFSADTATRSVAENTAAGVNIGAAVTARDTDSGATLTYGLSGTDGSYFDIDTGTGRLKTKDALNYETRNSYDNVIVTVRDSKDAAGDADLANDDIIAVTINVTNVNEAPVITITPTTDTFAENGTGTVVDFNATDVDAMTTLTWSVDGGADRSKFNIDSASGILTFRNPPDFEAPTDAFTAPETEGDNIYVVTVKVTDNHTGRLSDTHTVSVTVTNVNEAPEITSPPTTANFPENATRTVATFAETDQDTSSAQNTLTWTVETADDGGKFSITKNTDGDGELTFSSAPDFETPTDTGDTAMNNSYVVTVKVTDNGTPGLTDTHGITVTVTNVNEAPTIDAGSTAFSVDENTATTEIIQTYEASDVDASTTLTWSLEGEDAGDFTFTRNTTTGHGELRFKNAPDYEMPADDDDADMVDPDNDYQVTVKVTDNAPAANRLFATRDVAVTVNDLNERPVVSGDATHSFMEHEFDVADDDLHDEDFVIGAFTAYDDDGDDITWSKSGTDAVRFYIEPMTGVLSFSSRKNFEVPDDHGSNNEYNIIVNANDGQGEDNSVGSFTVTVTVTNVDETPEITGGDAAHSFAEIEYDATFAVLLVGIYTARDEEDPRLSWTLAGTDAADFDIVSAHGTQGSVAFKHRDNFPNFEMPTDRANSGSNHVAGDNRYEVIVRATDLTSPLNTREYPVTITVTDVNERPDISGDAAFSYVEVPYDNTAPLPPPRLHRRRL